MVHMCDRHLEYHVDAPPDAAEYRSDKLTDTIQYHDDTPLDAMSIILTETIDYHRDSEASIDTIEYHMIHPLIL